MGSDLMDSDLASARGGPTHATDTYADFNLQSARGATGVTQLDLDSQSPRPEVTDTMQSARGSPPLQSARGPPSIRQAQSPVMESGMMQSAQGRNSMLESDLQSAHGRLNDSRDTLLGSDLTLPPGGIMQSAVGQPIDTTQSSQVGLTPSFPGRLHHCTCIVRYYSLALTEELEIDTEDFRMLAIAGSVAQQHKWSPLLRKGAGHVSFWQQSQSVMMCRVWRQLEALRAPLRRHRLRTSPALRTER